MLIDNIPVLDCEPVSFHQAQAFVSLKETPIPCQENEFANSFPVL